MYDQLEIEHAERHLVWALHSTVGHIQYNDALMGQEYLPTFGDGKGRTQSTDSRGQLLGTQA